MTNEEISVMMLHLSERNADATTENIKTKMIGGNCVFD